MSDLFYMTPGQLERIRRYLPYPHGAPRVDDLRVISGIIYRAHERWRELQAPRRLRWAWPARAAAPDCRTGQRL